jgi:hypothetical protein
VLAEVVVLRSDRCGAGRGLSDQLGVAHNCVRIRSNEASLGYRIYRPKRCGRLKASSHDRS